MSLVIAIIVVIVSNFSEIAGNTCFHESTWVGECVNPNECESNEIINNSNCQGQKVCCPVLNGTTETAMRIENSSFAVILGYETRYGTIWKCGGALIKENLVLTTASCWDLRGLSHPIVIKTSLGEIIPIKYAITDPRYNGFEFDVANLILSKKSMAKSSCLTSNHFDGKYVQVVGFGSLSSDNMLHGSASKIFGVMDVYIESMGNKTFSVQTEGNSCVGDQGGVAVKRRDKESCPFPIVGVLSEWQDCGVPKSKGYFTKVRG